jgi:hypothetical protein
MVIPSTAAHPGHAHFWERAAERGVTRRSFLQRSAGVVGAAAGLGLVAPGAANAANASPKPIHVKAPGVLTLGDSEPITITDFNGNIGYAIIDGAGTGHDTATGATKRYSYNCDMRFMQGVYVAEDGRVRRGTFGFV